MFSLQELFTEFTEKKKFWLVHMFKLSKNFWNFVSYASPR